ncbi:uncharacterized protein LOC106870662 [Octopus bimaculoides]|uniref:uncharacterized protein LOC106870662 n=1 Tax=Octopus bimaculoides TaxID=37653 RepID=UPI00071E0818|nr:uncharacterized protein LOC106870662 [Octopus bimaculoides]|eukprot:XP_014772301.1 PREDICTED: uncharacterized protein LOC106870662 [Octopus bimaculoides]
MLQSSIQQRAHRRGFSTPCNSRCLLKTFSYNPNIQYDGHPDINIGDMSITCSFCNANKWSRETPAMCCTNGKVNPTPLQDPPQLLRSLYDGTNTESKHFLNNIRKYNCAFQMTSFSANVVQEGEFMPTFKVQGQVYHRIGSLEPAENKDPQFLQLYFLGNLHEQATRRNSISNGTKFQLIMQLQDLLHQTNSYVRSFKYALETDTCSNFNVVIDAQKRPSTEHAGCYNAPTCNEIAVLLHGQQHNPRDIVLWRRDTTLQRITETHRSYDTLQYPLLFVYGEDGYHIGIPQQHPQNRHEYLNKQVSCMDFYSYQCMTRNNSCNHLHQSQDLFHQFAVDMCAKMESERLCFIRSHQQKLRSDSYIHLRDAINNDAAPTSIGRLCILPSTFTGSPRYMHERTQDAMTFVRHYGRPDLFITFTYNHKWKEIQAELFFGQKPKDRHDILARAFHLKLIILMDLIKKGQIFGPIQCDMYTIEWQKMGLPHAHILLWLSTKIKSTDIDKIISAELPDPALDKVLYDIVKANMVHGPYGHGFNHV